MKFPLIGIKMKKLLLTGVLTISFSCLFAQPGGGDPGGGDDPGCWPPPCIPIDGGTSMLIAAGAAFGGKKLWDNAGEEEADEK